MTVTVLTISDRASRGVYEDRSGPEIEAVLRARFPAAVAALTVYDMCKAVDKSMVIEEIRLLEKSKG